MPQPAPAHADATLQETRGFRLDRVPNADADTDADTTVLIKHFKSPALLQRLTACFNCHPAQRETLWQTRLAELGLPAALPLDHHISPAGQHTLTYPDLGQPLRQWWARQHPTRDLTHRRALARRLGQLLAKLAAVHVLWPTASADDFFVSPDHTLHLINTGSCRGARGIPLLARLLPILQRLQADIRTAAETHTTPHLIQLTKTDRLRVYRGMLDAFPEPLDGMQHLPIHPDLN